ncbi:hypothetical protein NX784_28455, partial [Massilia pinisoli]
HHRSDTGTSSNAHTYRLFIVKELCIRYCLAALANRCVRQQQRSEIMQCFAVIVNFFLIPFEAFRTV